MMKEECCVLGKKLFFIALFVEQKCMMTRSDNDIKKFCKDFFQDIVDRIEISEKTVFIILDRNLYLVYLNEILLKKNSESIGRMFADFSERFEKEFTGYKCLFVIGN